MQTQVRTTNVEIREAGLVLRPWQPADADAVFRACQDPEIARWTTVPQPYRIDHAIDYVTTFTAQSWANGTGAPFGVLVCEWGFAALRLHRIEREGYLGNDASRSVAERAGFIVEGVRRDSLVQRGLYQSAWIGARLATDAIDVGDTPIEPRN